MKVTFNRAALSDALALVTSVVPGRTPKPILKCVKIEADTDTVRMSATDLEVGLSYTLSEVQVAEQGAVVIPADRLAAIVRETVDETIILDAENDSCKIAGSDSHFTIFCQDVTQFPGVPAFDGAPDIEITLQNLQAAISQCLFATAKESTRYALNGVLWEQKGKKMVLVATDGRRLARTRVALAAAEGDAFAEAKVIIPAKTMALVERISAAQEDNVSLCLAGNQVLFACGNIVISSSLVEGNFPKYDDIIPSDYDKKLSLNTQTVTSAVRRSSLLTSEESRGIKLAVSENKIVFTGRSPETGDAEVDMKVEYIGAPIEIGFNPQFIIDVLRVITGDTFDLELGQGDRPGLIKSGKDFIYVLMPINLG
jgi:DNA polymerase-3 subunit beta